MVTFDKYQKIRLIEPNEIPQSRSLEIINSAKEFVAKVSAKKHVTRIDITNGYVLTTRPDIWK